MPDRRRPRWTPGDIVLTTVVLATTLFLFINVGLFSAVTSPPVTANAPTAPAMAAALSTASPTPAAGAAAGACPFSLARCPEQQCLQTAMR